MMIKQIIILFSLFFMILSCLGAPEKSNVYPYDWTLIYYMSYDNNLSKHTNEIIDKLENGLKSKRIAVVIEADTDSKDGIKRIVLTSDGDKVVKKIFPQKEENSASDCQLSQLLSWVQKYYSAKKYAVTLLNHGGLLDQICQDNYTGTKNSRQISWMSSKKAGMVLRHFSKLNPGQLELLFIQQCGRGSIENIFNYEKTVNYILVSPLIVGAPNTYYDTMLQNLSKTPNCDGKEVAGWIMESDKHSFFLSLIDGKEVTQIPKRFNTLKSLLNSRKQFVKPIKKVFHFEHENYYDLTSYLDSIKVNNKKIADVRSEFLKWYQGKLVIRTHNHKNYPVQLSGLSIFIPAKKSDVMVYKNLPFFQKLKWMIELK